MRIRFLLFLTLCFFAAGVLGGCATTDDDTQTSIPQSPADKQLHIAQVFQQKNTLVAENILAQLAPRMPRQTRIISTAFVDLENFEKSTPLGRLVPAQIADHLTQAGYTVEEYRLRKTIGIRKQEGEFILTRDSARMLADTFQAEAVLLGNYLVDQDTLFLSVRIVRLDTRAVVAAHHYTLPNRALMHRLLAMEEEEKPQTAQTFSRYVRQRDMDNTAPPATASAQNTTTAPGTSKTPTPQEVFRLFPTTQ